MKTLTVNLAERGYDIYIGSGLLRLAGELFNLDRKALIVTDSGVPKEYDERVGALCGEARIITIEQGEGSKSAEGFINLYGLPIAVQAMVDAKNNK